MTLSHIIPAPRNILLSHYYYLKRDIDRLGGACRIVADSGAYTARYQGVTVTTKQLALWTKHWEQNLAWVACLDIAHPDTSRTRTNWLKMVNDHQLPAISTLHAGDRPDEMDWYAEQGVDFLGIGGVAGANLTAAAKWHWLTSVFKYAQDNHPQMRFHGWGMTGSDVVKLPFWSADSSGWGNAYRYGRVTFRDPFSNKDISLALDGKAVFKHPELMHMLRDGYGVTPKQIAKAGPHNRDLLVRLSALSASVYEQRWRYMYRNRPVEAPKWGRLKGWNFGDDPGPHIHLVDGYNPHCRIVADMANEYWRDRES